MSKNKVLLTVLMLFLPSDMLADAIDAKVLVIGVDGVNLSKILEDPANTAFFELMNEGTTAASSIVGHTTISNPSWTTILTGVWTESSGVINNVYTPWTYDSRPTVFNQLEQFDPNIDTVVITDWKVIADIANAGSVASRRARRAASADVVVFVDHAAGDMDWSATDDAVGERTVDAISSIDTADPTFLFAFFVGVDKNGYKYGSNSPRYEAALRNVDENIGNIMAAVDAREAMGEDWTVIVVTDHGHQPRPGPRRGFQSPDETSTFVIAEGTDFRAGTINLESEIVDVTPTVVTLFGGTPCRNSDGESMTTLGDSDVVPVDLHQALEDMIDNFGKGRLCGTRWRAHHRR